MTKLQILDKNFSAGVRLLRQGKNPQEVMNILQVEGEVAEKLLSLLKKKYRLIR